MKKSKFIKSFLVRFRNISISAHYFIFASILFVLGGFIVLLVTLFDAKIISETNIQDLSTAATRIEQRLDEIFATT